jgi:hypothetical protein
MPDNPTDAIQALKAVLAFILSWIGLTAISIIISGKLIARRIPLGFLEEDVFNINLIFFKLKSKGDEVSLGLIVFISNLGGWVIFGGPSAYEFFKIHAGIDVGQWNSLCIISSFASICIAFVFFAISGWATGVPVIAARGRATMLERIEALRDIRDDN